MSKSLTRTINFLFILFGITGIALLIINPVPQILNLDFFTVDPYKIIDEEDIQMALISLSFLLILTSILSILNEYVFRKHHAAVVLRKVFIKITSKDVYIYGILFLLTLFIYFRIFQIGFYQDDFAWLLDSQISSMDLSHIFSLSQSHFFRPVTHLYHLSNFFLFNENAALFHLSGILFHGLSAFLIYKIASYLFSSKWISLLAAFIFCCYYVSHKSVIWIAGSEITFASLLYLLSVYFYIIFLKSKRTIYMPISLFFFIAGILAKEAVITVVPFIFLLHIQSREPSRKHYWVYYALLGSIYLVVQLLLQSNSHLVTENIYELRLNIMYWNYVRYIFSAIIPEGYVLLKIFPNFLFYLQFLLLSIIGFLFLRSDENLRILVIWFLLTLLPFMPFNIPVQPRYLYLPSIPLSILLAKFIWSIYRKYFSYSDKNKISVLIMLLFLFGMNVLLTNFGISIMLEKQTQASAYLEWVMSNEEVMDDLELGIVPEGSPLSYDHLIAAIEYYER